MKVGFALPNFGRMTTPNTIITIAQEAERQGFASIWTSERLLYPRYFVPYGNNTQGIPIPDAQRTCYEPLDTLMYVAARTTRIQLGTSVIDAFFQAPIMLARRLATIDQFSGGRLVAGIGRGWMKEEFEAAGVPFERSTTGYSDYIKALRAVWEPNPVHYEGRFYRIAESDIDPKPIQQGGPKLLLGTSAPATIKLAAQLADGITPVFFRWEDVETATRDFFEQVRLAGRDPAQMEIAVRVNGSVSEQQLPSPRLPLIGSYEQVHEDVQRLKELGITHVLFDPSAAELSLTEQLRQMELVRRATEV